MKRLKDHLYCMRRGGHKSVLLQRAFNKYGEDAFVFKILCFCDLSAVDEEERRFIKLYDSVRNGYNIEFGGNQAKAMSTASRLKMSLAKKGKPTGRRGIKFSECLRLKLSLAHKGKPSPKKGTKSAYPAWNKGLVGVQASAQRCPVSVTDKQTGNFIGEFESIDHFRRTVGYKSKNNTRISDTQFSIGRYLFTKKQ